MSTLKGCKFPDCQVIYKTNSDISGLMLDDNRLSLYDHKEKNIKGELPDNVQILESSSEERPELSNRLTKIVKTTERTVKGGGKVHPIARKDCRSCYRN